MTNTLKRALFNLWGRYDAYAPPHKGRGILKRLIGRLGPAEYRVLGVRMALDPNGTLDRWLILRQSFDAEVHQVLDEKLFSGGVFLDIGANIGYYSLLAAAKPDVRVFAFEPSPRELRSFYRNISLNRFNNITVFPYGLSDRRQVLPLHLSADITAGMNSVLDLRPLGFVGVKAAVDCHFDTFDALIPPSVLPDVALCKIDVEGYEMAVLSGMRESLGRMRRATFLVEINPTFLSVAGNTPEEIYALFAEEGFRPAVGLKSSSGDIYDEVFTFGGG